MPRTGLLTRDMTIKRLDHVSVVVEGTRQPGSGLRLSRFCLFPPTIPDQNDLVIPNCKNRRPDPSLESWVFMSRHCPVQVSVPVSSLVEHDSTCLPRNRLMIRNAS